MKKISRKLPKCEVPSTAMGDIAFNLLIFFVILARAQDDSKVWEPAAVPKVESAGFSPATVLIDREQKLYLNGAAVGEQQLSRELETLLKNAPAGQRQVFLKCDKDAMAERFQPAIEAISQAGGELVHILNENKELK